MKTLLYHTTNSSGPYLEKINQLINQSINQSLNHSCNQI